MNRDFGSAFRGLWLKAFSPFWQKFMVPPHFCEATGCPSL
jgi:hypothetical protein